MKAKLDLGKNLSNARNYWGEKELVNHWDVIVLHKGELKKVVSGKCWMGRSSSSSVVYGSIWCVPPSNKPYLDKAGERYLYHFPSGRGQASGYGYHKESQAIAEAIECAGITLDQDIGGAGDDAIKEALIAIARMLGYRGKCLIV